MPTHHGQAGQDRTPVGRAAIFSTTIRSPSRRTAEFCGFAAAETVKVRKLGLAWKIAIFQHAIPGFVGTGDGIRPIILPGDHNEWMIDDKYGLRYHTSRSPADMNAEEMIIAERRKISFLCHKFTDDLQSPPAKILCFRDLMVARLATTSATGLIAPSCRRPYHERNIRFSNKIVFR